MLRPPHCCFSDGTKTHVRGDDCFGSPLLSENPPQNLVAYSINYSCVGQGFQKVLAGHFISALDGVGWAPGTGGSTSKMASSLLGMAPQCPWPVSLCGISSSGAFPHSLASHIMVVPG